MDTHPVRLLSIFSPTEPEVVLFQLYVDPQDFNLILATAVSMRVPDVSFRPGQWTHLGIVCSRAKSKGVEGVFFFLFWFWFWFWFCLILVLIFFNSRRTLMVGLRPLPLRDES